MLQKSDLNLAELKNTVQKTNIITEIKLILCSASRVANVLVKIRNAKVRLNSGSEIDEITC
mgnify:CR=1 FL=1